jgi:hypothetical protein
MLGDDVAALVVGQGPADRIMKGLTVLWARVVEFGQVVGGHARSALPRELAIIAA